MSGGGDFKALQSLLGGGEDANQGAFGNIVSGAAKLPRPARASVYGRNQAAPMPQARQPIPGAQMNSVARAGGERGPLSQQDIDQYGGGQPAAAQGQPLDDYARQELERRQRMMGIG